MTIGDLLTQKRRGRAYPGPPFFSTPSALERLHALKRAGSQVAINAREAVRFLDRVTSGKDNVAAERVILQGPMEQYEKWEEAEKFFLPEFEEDAETVVDQGVNGDEPVSSEKRGGLEAAAAEATASGKTKGGKKEANASPDDLSQMLLSKLNFKKESDAVSITSAGTHSGAASRTSSRSSRTSPECANGLTETNGDGSKHDKASRTNGHQRTASGSAIPAVPQVLRPLLSAVLWRLHGGPEAANVAKSCILVSNDLVVQSWAQKFGIGVKNIHQLRTSIQYEEREFKNRCKYVEKTQGQGPGQGQGQGQGQCQSQGQIQGAPEPTTLLSYEDESEEDELVFVPRGRGKGATRGGGTRGGGSNRKPAAAKNVAPPLESTVEVPVSPIDPDSFSRSLGGPTSKPKQPPPPPPVIPSGTAKASRGHSTGRRGGSRGSSRGSGRGRGKLWVP